LLFAFYAIAPDALNLAQAKMPTESAPKSSQYPAPTAIVALLIAHRTALRFSATDRLLTNSPSSNPQRTK
jgi:hypothetical protein